MDVIYISRVDSDILIHRTLLFLGFSARIDTMVFISQPKHVLETNRSSCINKWAYLSYLVSNNLPTCLLATCRLLPHIMGDV